MTTQVQVQTSPIFLSEILPLTISQPNLICFRLTPEVERQEGNRLAFRFSRQFPDLVAIWKKSYFWILAKPGSTMPDQAELKKAFANIQEQLKDEISDRYWSFQWVRAPKETPLIIAQLAVQVLRETKFEQPVVFSDKGVEVRREVDIWSETIELDGKLQPAVTITVRSSILYKGNLADFYNNHPFRQNPQKLLIGLKVQNIESGGSGTISAIVGKIGEHREKLIEKATGAVSKQSLRDAPDNQPLVGVQFGKNGKQYHYAMAALRFCITSETAARFEVEYGKLLKESKITHEQRQQLLVDSKIIADKALAAYGFKLQRSVNSKNFPSLFWQPLTPLEQTRLLFGQNVTRASDEILKGLSTGGVYRRHDEYRDPSRLIRIAALKLYDRKLTPFLEKVQEQLKRYGFESEIINTKQLSVKELSAAKAKAEVEKALDELLVPTPDIVLTFLPESDRHADREEDGSLYYWVYSRLLRRGIASQVIYEDTLKVQTNYVLNQVIPGVLAKLGNLPFILAEPLEVADYFVGLNISRVAKKNVAGSNNACASIRVYGRRGEFIRYHLEDAIIEGEEIPAQLLNTLLPASQLQRKTVLIYRDGRFCGNEVDNLLERAKAIDSKFILVECRKSYVPRLYNLNQKVVTAPKKGLALRKSLREAIVITTAVPAKVGLARPLRLTVHEQGHQVSIETVVEATLKLTLLHHGALKSPRLPMPLYGSDRMAYLRLHGIYPTGMLEGDRQFWL
ncbi:MAG: stem cell self-renewal protein Piwi [Hormoscilla sp. GM102CHS1]|nr:stem cell self-renewal protein Piwi [Hormoscilla sp. GM102CHS1]